MTAAQWVDVTDKKFPLDDEEKRMIEDVITEAVAEEREKLLTLIDEHITVLLDLGILKTSDSVSALKDLAAAIRKVKP